MNTPNFSTSTTACPAVHCSTVVVPVLSVINLLNYSNPLPNSGPFGGKQNDSVFGGRVFGGRVFGGRVLGAFTVLLLLSIAINLINF